MVRPGYLVPTFQTTWRHFTLNPLSCSQGHDSHIQNKPTRFKFWGRLFPGEDFPHSIE